DEPADQGLNGIMKWSLLVAWLHQEHRDDALGFLATQQVDRSAWFPDWVARKPALTFRRWDKVGFEKRGYKGTTTEAMPRLFSAGYTLFGEQAAADGPQHQLSGGVSLAGKDVLEVRVPLPATRSGIGRFGLGGIDIKTLEGSRFT